MTASASSTTATPSKEQSLGFSADAAIPIARLLPRVGAIVREGVSNGYWMTGEVIDLRRGTRGAARFELRDQEARIACVMSDRFASSAADLLANGRRVAAFATVYLDTQDGRLRLDVTDVQDHGDGVEQRKLEQLRERLRREGLFDARRKRPVPVYPAGVALITSLSGAARHDFVAVARRRNPGVPILVIPATMQRGGAVPSIIAALRRAPRTSCEVVVIARGGGSPADLAILNSEELVRAIAACRLPVVTAIGHETDALLVDEVADLRAGTPSMGAEQTIPERKALVAALESRASIVKQQMASRLRQSRADLGALRSRLAYAARTRVGLQRARLATMHDRLRGQVVARCHRDRITLDRRRQEMGRGMTSLLQREAACLAQLSAMLSALNPHAVLARGFAFLTDEQGRVVSSIAGVREAGALTLRMHDGDIRVVVFDQAQLSTEATLV